MARRAALLVALATAPASSLVAPVAPSSCARRQRTRVQESFGFDFVSIRVEIKQETPRHRADALTGTRRVGRGRGDDVAGGARPSLSTQAEDQAENTADGILGERRLKEEFIRSYKPTATVLEGKPYPVFQEVQEKRILSATVNSGLLQSLDNLGLGLGDVEKLLPFLDKFGLIGLVRKNLPLAIIATGYLLIEPAPFLLPVLGLLLSIPTAAWTAVAAVTTAAEVYLNAFASFEDAGLVSLLLAPLLLIAGVLSLVPTAIGAIKSLPPV